MTGGKPTLVWQGGGGVASWCVRVGGGWVGGCVRVHQCAGYCATPSRLRPSVHQDGSSHGAERRRFLRPGQRHHRRQAALQDALFNLEQPGRHCLAGACRGVYNDCLILLDGCPVPRQPQPQLGDQLQGAHGKGRPVGSIRGWPTRQLNFSSPTGTRHHARARPCQPAGRVCFHPNNQVLQFTT